MAREVVEASAQPERDEMCPLEWTREAGLWDGADDAGVLARYGRDALDGHWYCCRAKPWHRVLPDAWPSS